MSKAYAIAGLVRRVTLMVARGRVTQSDDSGPIQTLQIPLGPKEAGNVKRVGEYGLASWPPDGCDGIAVFLSGDRTNGAVVATHDLASRFKLGHKGEVALFDNSGDQGKPGRWFWFKLGNTPSLELEAKNTPININNAKGITINNNTTDVTINFTGGANLVLDLGGSNVTIKNPGQVVLSDQNGEKALVRDGDPVTGGVVHATQTAVKA